MPCPFRCSINLDIAIYDIEGLETFLFITDIIFYSLSERWQMVTVIMAYIMIMIINCNVYSYPITYIMSIVINYSGYNYPITYIMSMIINYNVYGHPITYINDYGSKRQRLD